MASVRGTRTVYRERDEERDYEEQPRRSYTTVKRYQVPESVSRAVYKDDEEEEDTKIVIKRKTREAPAAPASVHYNDDSWKFTERRYEREPQRSEVDYRYSRAERSADPPRRDVSYRVVERENDWDRRSRNDYRVVERDTEVVRAPSPPSPERVREFRFERERDFSPQRERPYDIEKYSRSTEYFSQPQPIIIRESQPQAPIIIREERREPQKIIIRREEPQYEFIERREERHEEERDESRSLVKKEESQPPAPVSEPDPPAPAQEQKPEEDYFYERRVVERRRRSDSYDRKTEIRPRDSASQYSSDDSYEYVRRERVVDDDKPAHRRHLAEGAIAGIGAAEVLRHHRKSKGEAVGGRGRSAIGGAAVGALGAEALSRVKSMRSLRRGSDSRSRSSERGERRRRKRRSRSRSEGRGLDLSRAQQLGGLAAVAAVGALAGYALKNRGKNNETVVVHDRPGGRSRSRRRRASVGSYSDDGRGMSEHRDPDHRNRRIAQAGLASAAAAGILEKVRSRSRGAKGRSKSQSRVRQGVPIAAAGLGGAALAGLYEKNKANKEAKKDAIIEDEMGRGRRRHSRSRSRGRSVPARYPDDDDRRSVDGPGLIAYGQDPIYHDDHRAAYSDEEPGMYRRRGGSSGSSPDTRHRRGSRSRSRGRHFAETAGAAGAAGVAAHEVGKRRERSRAERDRRQDHERQDEYYRDNYGQEPYSPPPMGNNGYIEPNQHNTYGQPPYGQQQQYPGNHYFPPPPTNEGDPYAHINAAPQQNAYPAYNPADYANQPPQAAPYGHGAYGESDAHLGEPYANDTFAGDPRHQNYERGRGRSDPENVSAPNETPKERESQEADGLRTPRQRSSSRVRFDLESNVAHSPEQGRRKDDAKRDDPAEQRHSDTETGEDRKHRRRRRRGKEREREQHRDSPDLMHDKYDRRPDDDDNDSEGTVELPERFDEHGNRKADDPLAQKINDLLSGQGGAGGLFKALAGGLMGGSGGGGAGDDRDDDSRSSRRRHRR